MELWPWKNNPDTILSVICVYSAMEVSYFVAESIFTSCAFSFNRHNFFNSFRAILSTGIFASSMKSIHAQDMKVWKALQKTLERGNNIEEGHYAERR